MSIVDQLRDLERQVVGRLRELEPLMREYDQLRKAARRFGLKYPSDSSGAAATSQRSSTRRRTQTRAAAQSAATTPAKGTRKRPTTQPTRGTSKSRASSSSTPRSRVRRSPAAPGQRAEEVLRLVGENPGITTSDIGKRLSVDSTGLYRVVRRLTEEGRIRRDGAQLHLVGSPRKAADAEAKPGPSAGSDAAAPTDSPAADAGT